MAIALSPSSRPGFPITVILFDVDGVLWDTRRSYDSAILKTVDYMVTLAKRPELQGRVGETDLRLMRRAGQLNNDWALTYVLFTALFHDYLDLGLAATDTAGKGVAWAQELRGPVSRLEFDLIQRYFDLVYWGHEDFKRQLGNEPPPLPFQAGTWHREAPLISRDVFQSLAAAGITRMGIATGRSNIELQTVLQDGLLDEFISPAAMCTGDILSKPDPKVVDWCLGRLGFTKSNLESYQVGGLFCGDTSDDLQLALNYATRNSGAAAPGIWLGGVSVVPENDFEFYLQMGAVACIDHVQNLPDLIQMLNQRTE